VKRTLLISGAASSTITSENNEKTIINANKNEKSFFEVSINLFTEIPP
jgi:hypothetical protein